MSTIEEKKQDIIGALEQGIKSTAIDIENFGKYAHKLSKDEEVPEEIIDEMHKQVLKLQKEYKKGSKLEEEKKEIIRENELLMRENKLLRLELKAVRRELQEYKLNNQNKAGYSQGDYENFIKLERLVDEIRNTIDKHEREITALKKENIELKKQLEKNIDKNKKIQNEDTNEEENEILGFTLIQKKSSTKNTKSKQSPKWYAQKQGKTIYIGKDKSKAEEKIEAYLKKHKLVKVD